MSRQVLITGVERSGSTLIARIAQICGAFTGVTTNMLENIELREICRKYVQESMHNGELMPVTENLQIPVGWSQQVRTIWGCESCNKKTWVFKSTYLAQMWPVWHYAFPNAYWIIVRRRTGDVIESCKKTGYMTMFKDSKNLEKICAETEDEGWKWWIHQYEKKFVEMMEAGLNCRIIWPERMVTGDYQQIYEMLEWLGMKWTPQIVETIDPMLLKSRRKENGVDHTK